MRARNNKSSVFGNFLSGDSPTRKVPVSPTLRLSESETQAGLRDYEDKHWGIPALEVVDWKDPEIPGPLAMMGRLVRLHVRAPADARMHPRRQRDTKIEFSRALSSNSYVAYELNHPADRIQLLVEPRAASTFKQVFWNQNTASPVPLGHLASVAGGRHGRLGGYPNIQVKPVGVLTAIVYLTHKKGDGNEPNYYIHNVGEVSLHYPLLAVDAKGRLWVAGGSMTVPSPGITD